jgi:Zn-dependent M28 family amino/carboxypeptidase
MPLEPLMDNLRAHVQRLAATPRPPGTPAHRQAAGYIQEQLRQAGFTVEEAPFQVAGSSGVNLLTRPLPDNPLLPLVIVGAHYDSIPGSPGADDNASAVAALLELARAVAPRLSTGGPWHARLQLAAYDLEEYGLIGSFAHSRDLRKANAPLRGMISLEMLGYTDSRPGSQRLPPHLAHLYPNVANFIGVVGNDGSRGLLQVVTEGLKSVAGLPVEFLAVPGDGRLIEETRLSDHASFWDQGFPALMITDTSFFRNPHYHQASDTPETLDYPFLARVTAGVSEAVQRLLRAERLPGEC